MDSQKPVNLTGSPIGYRVRLTGFQQPIQLLGYRGQESSHSMEKTGKQFHPFRLQFTFRNESLQHDN